MNPTQKYTNATLVQDSYRERRQEDDDPGDTSTLVSLQHRSPSGPDYRVDAKFKDTELIKKGDLPESDSSSEENEILDDLLTGGDLLVDFTGKGSELVGFHPATPGVTVCVATLLLVSLLTLHQVNRPQYQKAYKYGNYTILLGLDDYPVPEYRSFVVTLCDKDENPLSGPNPPLRLYERGDPQCVLPVLGFSAWMLPSSRRWIVKDVSDGDREVMQFGGTILQDTVVL